MGDVTLEIDPIEDPVGAALRAVPVLERGAEPPADALWLP